MVDDEHPIDSRSRFDDEQRLLEKALELPQAERAGCVEREAGGDHDLARRVLELLRYYREDSSPDAAADPGPAMLEPQQLDAAWLGRLPPLDRERYVDRVRVGAGGMGTVYRVFDRELRRHLALKVPHAAVSDGRPDYRSSIARFLREARVTGQLDHPGVVSLHELCRDQDGRPCFLMGYVRGQTGRAVFDQTRRRINGWTQGQALQVLQRVCETMAYAHGRGVLHRDLKPDNVMVGAFGEVYVMDWGLARLTQEQEDAFDLRVAEPGVADDGRTVCSVGGQELGTPYYMAPEQAAGHPLDERSDVYAIGAMLYELLVGHPPYHQRGATAREVLQRVRAGAPPRVDAVVRGAPPGLVSIVECAMARDREQRYRSVAELGRELRAFVELRAVKAHRTGPVVELVLWMRRNPALAGSLGVAVLVLVMAVLFAAKASRYDIANAQLAVRRAAPTVPVAFDSLAPLRELIARGAACSDGGLDDLLGDRILPTRESWPWPLGRRLAAVEQMHRIYEQRGRDGWRRVQRELAGDPRFAGCTIEPEPDLVPLRRDPCSGLQWFWHPPIGEEPRLDEHDRYVVEEATGLVFVLLPPGCFRRGLLTEPGCDERSVDEVQADTMVWAKYATEPDGDCWAVDVAVAPFFLSAFELTQAQWRRLTDRNPSLHPAGFRQRHPDGYWIEIDGRHPVENVDAVWARLVLSMIGLELPSESRWEYAYQAGHHWFWTTGDDPYAVFSPDRWGRFGINALDTSLVVLEPTRNVWARDLPCSDGFALHAPVDVTIANDWGLVAMAGNVAEWCADVYYPYAHIYLHEDLPHRAFGDRMSRLAVRGGSFRSPIRECSAYDRYFQDEFACNASIGIRPMRSARYTWD